MFDLAHHTCRLEIGCVRVCVQGWTGFSSSILTQSDHSPVSVQQWPHDTQRYLSEQEQVNIKQENYPIIRKTLLFYHFVGM